MKRLSFIIVAVLLSGSAISEAYRCKTNGASVIQDQPCPGSVRRGDSMPSPSAASAASDDEIQAKRDKLEQDKRYIDERVKARIHEREREAAQQDISRCDAQAASILKQVDELAASAPSGQPINLASAAALQLDQQRRQTKIQSLQSQHSAKLAQCAQKRQAFKDKYGN